MVGNLITEVGAYNVTLQIKVGELLTNVLIKFGDFETNLNNDLAHIRMSNLN